MHAHPAFCDTQGDAESCWASCPLCTIPHDIVNDLTRPSDSLRHTTRAVVITTAMLSFITYWRAASVVLCDLASSAYYACGIAEKAIGKAAPWFVLAIMVFSMLVRLVFMESCAMFVRGGVYKTVKSAIGGVCAKFAVSALLFDYVLTGPISAVAAAQYFTKFFNQSAAYAGYAHIQLPSWSVMLFASLIIGYFWRKNIIGVGESSTKSLRIVQLTSVMIVLLFVWSIVTLILNPQPLPPFTPVITDEALGWLVGFDWTRTIPIAGVVIALGHSLLAMSGEESLTQVYREIAAPKMKNLKRAVVIICIYSFTLTGLISLLAVMIIPDAVRPEYYGNLLSGLAMHLAGPTSVQMAMQAFVVLVGVLLLSGAVNTSLVGANGDLNRMAEDGVLPQWLRRPHPRFGTTSRMMHCFAGMQLLIVIASQGNIYALGAVYAFGVVWSFVFQTLSVLVLRWRNRSPREFRVPFNIPLNGTDFPLGILFVTLVLMAIAVTNFMTKTMATKTGVVFTLCCFAALSWSESRNKKRGGAPTNLEKVNLDFATTATPESCGLEHNHRILCAVRDPHNLTHLRKALQKMDPEQSDCIVLSVKKGHVPTSGDVEALPLDEQLLITNVVSEAETCGVHVKPIIIPATDPIYAMVKVAYDLGANEIIVGRSGRNRPEIQLEKIAMAWGFVSAKSPRPIRIRIIWPQRELKFDLG